VLCKLCGGRAVTATKQPQMEIPTMSQLTVTEKNHWKERITRKIEQAIEELYAKDKPTFLEEIAREARRRAIASLGLVELKATVEQIKQENVKLEKDRAQAYRAMLAILEGKPIEDVQTTHYSEPYEVERAIARRAKVHEKEILEGTELGRKVLALDRENYSILSGSLPPGSRSSTSGRR
jgi:hypothetical protein